MSAVQRHYDELLGPIYSWTLGGYDERVQASATLFGDVLGASQTKGRALDLGCGTGVQTHALLRRGFEVVGIDFSETILEEYRARTSGHPVEARVGDISEVDLGTGFDVAVCLGDTVAHLQSWSAVDRMFAHIARALVPGGQLILATRDHSVVLEGDARFLLIRADEHRSMTCFVEDAGEHIRVTDLVHERREGKTEMRASSYHKLRVSPERLMSHMAKAGLGSPACHPWRGVHVITATKGVPS